MRFPVIVLGLAVLLGAVWPAHAEEGAESSPAAFDFDDAPLEAALAAICPEKPLLLVDFYLPG